MVQDDLNKCIVAYKSLVNEKFRGCEVELLNKIEEKLNAHTLTAWKKTRLKALKDRIKTSDWPKD